MSDALPADIAIKLALATRLTDAYVTLTATELSTWQAWTAAHNPTIAPSLPAGATPTPETHHVEPYDAATLTRWLRQRGCTFLRQRGSHTFWLTNDGLTVGAVDPGSDHPVTTIVAGNIAKAFGLTVHDLRRELGYGSTRPARNRAARAAKSTAPSPIIVPPPSPVHLTAEALVATATAIARSGPCRKASPDQARHLERLLHHVASWYTNNANGTAA